MHYDLAKGTVVTSSSKDIRLVKEIRTRNLLSFGPESLSLELENLNVLIGPNGVGKTNLIEVLSLIRATPVPEQFSGNSDVRGVIRRGGGANEWIWKGEKEEAASIELVVRNSQNSEAVRHHFAFASSSNVFELVDERIEKAEASGNQDRAEFYYRFEGGSPVVNSVNKSIQKLPRHSVDPSRSILSQRRDPESYPEISFLAESYEKIRVYRECTFGLNSIFREPQRADIRNDRLEENFSNLGLFLNRMKRSPSVKKTILEALGKLCESFTDFDVFVEGGSVQVFFTEGNFMIPATRLSDGTLRYLCLLAILCDPTPPPLICIEEPELGIHPDILPTIADLLISASSRTQLIVTTHSDILIDAMTENPEVVVVCEKEMDQTTMRRLNRKDLADWLAKYRLGQLWMKGQIGGTRW